FAIGRRIENLDELRKIGFAANRRLLDVQRIGHDFFIGEASCQDMQKPIMERHGEAMRIDVPGSLTLDEPDLMAQASRAGIGLAYVGEWMVADDITSGRLVEVLSQWTPSYPGYCLYYPGRRHMAASLRAFVDLAKEIVFRNPAKAS